MRHPKGVVRAADGIPHLKGNALTEPLPGPLLEGSGRLRKERGPVPRLRSHSSEGRPIESHNRETRVLMAQTSECPI